MVERLAELGAPIELEAITRGADPRRSPGRLHVARALVAAGHVQDVREAFDRFLAAGQPGYVQDQVPSARDALAMIRGLGGLSVVAHPALDLAEGDLADLAGQGLDGVEAFHHCHGPDQAAEWAARAAALRLVVTGGSDYHGDPRQEGAPPPDAAAEQRLGHVPLPRAAWEAFDAALAARAAPRCDVG
jgi:predicted metal-dependent phosphoesterase TrpH